MLSYHILRIYETIQRFVEKISKKEERNFLSPSTFRSFFLRTSNFFGPSFLIRGKSRFFRGKNVALVKIIHEEAEGEAEKSGVGKIKRDG